MGHLLPKGGTGALVAALEALMRRNDIKIRFSEEVEKIVVRKGKAEGFYSGAGKKFEAISSLQIPTPLTSTPIC